MPFWIVPSFLSTAVRKQSFCSSQKQLKNWQFLYGFLFDTIKISLPFRVSCNLIFNSFIDDITIDIFSAQKRLKCDLAKHGIGKICIIKSVKREEGWEKKEKYCTKSFDIELSRKLSHTKMNFNLIKIAEKKGWKVVEDLCGRLQFSIHIFFLQSDNEQQNPTNQLEKVHEIEQQWHFFQRELDAQWNHEKRAWSRYNFSPWPHITCPSAALFLIWQSTLKENQYFFRKHALLLTDGERKESEVAHICTSRAAWIMYNCNLNIVYYVQDHNRQPEWVARFEFERVVCRVRVLVGSKVFSRVTHNSTEQWIVHAKNWNVLNSRRELQLIEKS